MKFSNVGGSLGNGAVLLLVLWSVHCWRQFRRDEDDSPEQRPAKQPRFLGRISALALRHLVEHGPVLHCVVDLRAPDVIGMAPLPDAPGFRAVTVALEPGQLAACLKSEAAWRAAVPDGPDFPTAGHLLIFVTPREEDVAAAAAAAATANFQRCLHLAGPWRWDQLHVPSGKYINRDACAYLLSLQQQNSAPQDFTFVDLRRHDERALYGAIQGSVHIPVESFVFAVQRDGAGFEALCHTRKPPQDELLILQSRSDRRSAWAARIAEEYGYRNVLIYKQGSYGWRIDPQVKSYAAYQATDPPPEPEELALETVDGNAAVEELKLLGIISS